MLARQPLQHHARRIESVHDVKRRLHQSCQACASTDAVNALFLGPVVKQHIVDTLHLSAIAGTLQSWESRE